MNTVLICIYAMLIIMNGISAGINLKNDRRDLATLDIMCAMLWVICLVFRIVIKL